MWWTGQDPTNWDSTDVKVLFIAQYGSIAASSRTRVFDYLPLLKSRGVCADLEVVTPDGLILLGYSRNPICRLVYFFRVMWNTIRIGLRSVRSAPDYDVIFIQKVIFPFPFPQLLRRFREKIVFDFDDAIFTLEDPARNLVSRFRTYRRSAGTPQMLRSASHAIVENSYTGEYARGFCKDVSTITGPIDTDRYRNKGKNTCSEVVLGWIGSPTTTPYLELIREPLRSLGKTFPDLVVCLIGASECDIDGIEARFYDWSLETEVDHLALFDIGLMPLPDDPFTQGKGGYKLLQYQSMGLPVVASPVGINGEIVEDGVNGLLANGTREWVVALTRLIESPDLRVQMGRRGRDKMVKEFSLTKSSLKFQQILETVALGAT